VGCDAGVISGAVPDALEPATSGRDMSHQKLVSMRSPNRQSGVADDAGAGPRKKSPRLSPLGGYGRRQIRFHQPAAFPPPPSLRYAEPHWNEHGGANVCGRFPRPPPGSSEQSNDRERGVATNDGAGSTIGLNRGPGHPLAGRRATPGPDTRMRETEGLLPLMETCPPGGFPVRAGSGHGQVRRATLDGDRLVAFALRCFKRVGAGRGRPGPISSSAIQQRSRLSGLR